LQDFDESFSLNTGAGDERASASIHLRKDQIHGEFDGLTGAVRAVKNLLPSRRNGLGFP
jgi:hypothetical protein